MRFILRTTLVAALTALAWTAALEMPAKAQASGSDYFVYFGTYTRGPSKGIYAYRFEPAAGVATLSGVAVETDDATGLALRVAPVRKGGRLEPAVPGFWV